MGKKMKIEHDIKEKKAKVKDDTGGDPTNEAPPANSVIVDAGFYVVTENSPECAYYYYGGRWYKICSS